MKKKLILIISIILLSISITGCIQINRETISVDEQEIEQSDNFFIIDEKLGTVYVDKRNNCQYLFVKRGYGAGMVLLVNPDGTPMLYEEK